MTFNVTGLFSRINNKINSYSFKKSLKMNNEYTDTTSIKGYSGSISLRKTKEVIDMVYGLTLKTINSIQMT